MKIMWPEADVCGGANKGKEISMGNFLKKQENILTASPSFSNVKKSRGEYSVRRGIFPRLDNQSHLIQ